MSAIRHQVTIEELIAFNDEIIALTRNGVPLEAGLKQAGSDFQGSMGRLSVALGERMEKGETLDVAISNESSNLPPVYRAIVEAGLRAGVLPIALQGISRFARKLSEVRQLVSLSLVYPLIVCGFAYLLVLVFLGEFLQRFLSFYSMFRLEESLPLRLLAMLSGSMWYWALIPPFVVGVLLWSWQRSARGTLFQLSGPLRFLPGMRGLHQKLQLGNFSELLGLLIEQQVPLTEALPLAGEASADPELLASVTSLVSRLRQGSAGESRSEETTRGLPPFLSWLLTSGQPEGKLVTALRQAGRLYQRQALRQSEWMRVWVPVAAVVLIGGGATAFYALTLYWPLVELYGDLSQ